VIAAPAGSSACLRLTPPTGAYCWDTMADCTAGLNACNSTLACQQDAVRCSTGVAGGFGMENAFFCPTDVPQGAVSTGEGILCYDSFLNCVSGASLLQNLDA